MDSKATNGSSQKGHSMADGYTFPFLFSGAEHSALLHLKLIIDIMLACH
jgi:hypothetical protein